ncbi:urea ABC transporter ATP-binding subunit UrtE [Teredinibacter purpureus]|uniref:urea ABC transporter ATP-binding subunit UrtE n=1 Tax=Teredinibacter purpureus TaxID=2731756 RepID=UPI0005F7B2A7|nr:urea ABC transporter ATP-binding subunit UrtE [Teredinibacter purpureus]
MLKAQNIDLFYGASQALTDVSLEAKKGEITCILGRNGVGKSSLMQAVTGRHPVSDGSVYWNDQNITQLTAADRARLGIAYVPQGRQIFSQLTVMENLKTGFAALPRSQRKVKDEIFDLFPVLRKMMRRRGGDLSGGQQQQLSIARALVMQPNLLILDEPTEGIQPSIIKDIHKVITILRQQGEMAIILVEQYFEFARDLGDKYSVMDRGVVTLSGDIATMNEQDVRKYLTV